MIANIEIDGFKSVRHYNFYLKNLNILTGLNSSGKSTVIQAIRILSNISNGLIDVFPDGMGGESALRNVETNELNITGTILSDKGSVTCEYKDQASPNFKYFPNAIYISADRTGGKNTVLTKENHVLYPNGDNVLSCIDYYNEHTVLQKNLCPDDNSTSTSFRMVVEKWLQAITPSISFEYQFIKLADSSYSTYNGYRASNVGYGLSYTLSVIVAVLMGVVEKNTVVLIENPEAHLHPKGQVMMANLFCKAVAAGAQIVVETHSDHFFDGVRIYAKENTGFNDMVKPYWFKLMREGDTYHTEVEQLEISKSGRLNRWPEDMFTQFLTNAEKLI